MDDKRTVALGLKSCLESLKDDATRADLADLARFIGLAVLAAEEAAAGSKDAKENRVLAFASSSVGHC